MNYIIDYKNFVNESIDNCNVVKIENKEQLMRIVNGEHYKLFKEEIEKEEHRLDFGTYNYFGYFEDKKCNALISITEYHYVLNQKGTMGYIYLDCLESKKKGCGKKLLEKIENKAKHYGYKGIILMTYNENIIPYYTKLGFDQVMIDGINYMKKKITKYN